MGYVSSGGFVAAAYRISVEVQIVLAYLRPGTPQTAQRLHRQRLIAVLNGARTSGSFQSEPIQGVGTHHHHELSGCRLELIQGCGVDDHELSIGAVTTR